MSRHIFSYSRKVRCDIVSAKRMLNMRLHDVDIRQLQ